MAGPIPFPISSAPGDKPQEGAGRLKNCYAEKLGEGARAPVRWLRSPGLRQVNAEIVANTHCRGLFITASAGTLFTVMDNRVYTITKSGEIYTAVNQGALAGTGRGTFAKNNNATPDYVFCCDDGTFNLFTGSTPTAFVDADIGSANSVCSLHGYFIFSRGDGTLIASSLNSVSVPANSYNVEQGLEGRRVVTLGDDVFFFGDKWTAVYYDAATSPFPLGRKFAIERGIVGTHAVAGWEEGWAKTLLWVADNNTVVQLNGYTPVKVSTPDVDRVIANSADPSLIECSVYMSGGNAFWVMTNPGLWTWEYNLTTQNWNERKSYGLAAWRASSHVFAYGKWLTGDQLTGQVYQIDESYYREHNNPLVFSIESGIVANFPNRFAGVQADFDFTAAVGSASGETSIQTDPQVSISWSKRGGYGYGNPVLRSIGAQGNANQRVGINRLGAINPKGIRFKLEVSDPVYVALLGGKLSIDNRSN